MKEIKMVPISFEKAKDLLEKGDTPIYFCFEDDDTLNLMNKGKTSKEPIYKILRGQFYYKQVSLL